MKHQFGFVVVLALMAALLPMAGCEEENITNVYEDGSIPTYTLTGRVMSYPSGAAVPGATFTLAGTGATGSSDENGLFRVEAVPAGTHQVVVAAAAHASSRVDVQLPMVAVNKGFSAHQDFYIVETTAALDLTVFGTPGGMPLPDVTVEVAKVILPYTLSDHEVDRSSFAAGGKTGPDGIAHLSGLPAVELHIAAQACDQDDDGVTDYRTQAADFAMTPDRTTSGQLMMQAGSGASLGVVASNLPDYSSSGFVAGNIWFIFSDPMDTGTSHTRVSVSMYYSPHDPIEIAAEWKSPIRLEITSMDVLTDADLTYSLEMDLQSDDGRTLRVNRTLRWLTGTDSGGGDCLDEVTDLARSPAGAPIDFTTCVVELQWSAVPGSGGYRVYAHDDRDNPDWVAVKDEPTDYETGVVSTSCVLPARFDRFQADGIQTPFAGTVVTFCVVPLRAAVPEPGLPHAVLTLRDETSPAITTISQTGPAVNPEASSAQFEIRIGFSEYISPDAEAPTLVVQEYGGDPNYAIDPAQGTWTWLQGRRSGKFAFTLNPGLNASGDRVHVVMTDLTDISDNVAAGESSSGTIALKEWGDIFDFESSSQHWTRIGQGWEWGTPTIGPNGAHSGNSCWGTSLAAQYGASWDTSLYSPEFTVCGQNPTVSFWCWYELSYSDNVRVYVVNAQNVSQELQSYSSNNSYSWVQRAFSLSAYAGQTIRIRFGFTSNSYDSGDGFFVDDVRIGCD